MLFQTIANGPIASESRIASTIVRTNGILTSTIISAIINNQTFINV